MSQWPSTRARLVLSALLRIGWSIKRQSGTSHKVLSRSGWADYETGHDNPQQPVNLNETQDGYHTHSVAISINEPVKERDVDLKKKF